MKCTRHICTRCSFWWSSPRAVYDFKTDFLLKNTWIWAVLDSSQFDPSQRQIHALIVVKRNVVSGSLWICVMQWLVVSGRGSCWVPVAVTAPCAVLTSPALSAGSAREAPGAANSATSSTRSWPSVLKTPCRYSPCVWKQLLQLTNV